MTNRNIMNVFFLLLFALASSYGAPSSTCSAGDGTCSNDADVTEKTEELCKDLHPKCEIWASQGECNANPNYMEQNCPVSCKSCPVVAKRSKLSEVEKSEENGEEGGKDGKCEDKNPSCLEFASQGKCGSKKSVREECPRSCYTCVNENDNEQKKKLIKSYMDWKENYKTQTVVGADEEKEQIDVLLEKVDVYSRVNLTSPEYETIRKTCHNHHDLCTYWAVNNDCIHRVQVMMDLCPLSCRMCELLPEYEKCGNLRSDDAKPSVTSVNTIFKNIIDANPKAEVLSGGNNSDPFVLGFDQFLSEKESDHFIDLSTKLVGWKSAEINLNEYRFGLLEESYKFDAQEANCKKTTCKDDISKAIINRVSELLKIPSNFFSKPEFLQYNVNQGTGLHHDYHFHDYWRPAGPKVLTFLLFLNDVDEGGPEGFPLLDWLFVLPKKGSALLWSNVLDQNPKSNDVKMVHQSLPVTEGEKYVMKMYVHLYDKKDIKQDCA